MGDSRCAFASATNKGTADCWQLFPESLFLLTFASDPKSQGYNASGVTVCLKKSFLFRSPRHGNQEAAPGQCWIPSESWYLPGPPRAFPGLSAWWCFDVVMESEQVGLSLLGAGNCLGWISSCLPHAFPLQNSAESPAPWGHGCLCSADPRRTSLKQKVAGLTVATKPVRLFEFL